MRIVLEEVGDRLGRVAERERMSVSAFVVRELAELPKRADNGALLADLPALSVRATASSSPIRPRPEQDGCRALRQWASLGVSRFSERGLLDRVWELRDNMSAYDATYVASAETLNCELVTPDARLARAPGPRCPMTVPPVTRDCDDRREATELRRDDRRTSIGRCRPHR